jgi:L-asparaginase
VTAARRRKWQRQQGTGTTGRSGTIGCVCGSAEGTVAAVTSTGGVGNETVGRIGDTPGIAGTWCDGRTAVSCTGQGEQIVNLGLAHRIGLRVEDGASLETALRRSLEEARLRAFEVAAIAVHWEPEAGRIAWAAGGTAEVFCWSRATGPGSSGAG